MSVDRFSEAQLALQRGDKARARQLLSLVLVADRNNEQAWLMMARLVETEKQVIECLEWALKVNPGNISTQRALNSLKRRPASRVYSPAVTRPEGSVTTAAPRGEIPSAIPSRSRKVEIPLPRVKRRSIPASLRRTNWSLLIGSFIVLVIVLVGIFGRILAPQDPMEEMPILQVGDQWHIPPFNALEVPGYLLGTDEFGRDLFSRILYAVRPTLVMVAIVAVVRLFFGTLIGLGAGWSNGRVGRTMDALISAALSVPILLVALGAIAMLGAEIGLLAFIVGLSLNGWGETARFVREQTKLIKGQLYIESAQALGASNFQILFGHVLRQIMPMVWMLFAFEIGGTLMVTAGLGFLGYYIGGDVWIEVRDFVSRRTSGEPELGQMLATSWVNLLQPWPLVLTGSVVFLTVLGFNLLGDGLRSRLNPEYINRNSPLSLLNQRFKTWYDQHISYPVSNWMRGSRLRPVLVGLTLIVLAMSVYLYEARVSGRFNPSQVVLSVPGGQTWGSELIDPYGTRFMHTSDLENPQVLWTITNSSGYSGSPVVAADGTLYAASLDSALVALDVDGTVRWTSTLPVAPLGSLAIGPQGDVYVTDKQGGLSAFGADGHLLWTYTNNAYGKPVHGAIVDENGSIYYLLEDPRGATLIALSPDGALLWSMKPGTHMPDTALRLSPDGQTIFVSNKVVNTVDGTLVDITLPTQSNPALAKHTQLLTGADGNTYLHAGHIVMQWQLTEDGFYLVQSADWDYRGIGFYQTSSYPIDAGATPDGTIWLLYSGIYGATRIVWLDPTGKFIGTIRAAYFRDTRVVGVDGNSTVTLCGVAFTDQDSDTTMCSAFLPSTEEDHYPPQWEHIFGGDVNGIVGTAMTPDRLYVITGDGKLTALADSPMPEAPAATP